jgi:hypothetical protein
VLSRLLVGVRAVYPALPFWFREAQLLATAVALAVVCAGGVRAVRER